jgi:rhomboid protease GluP
VIMNYETGDFLSTDERMEKEGDREKFSRSLEHFSILEEMAMDAMQPSDTVSKEIFLTGLRKTALIDWTECINLMDEAEKLDLPERLDSLRVDLAYYASSRVQQTLLYIKANEEATNKYNHGIDSFASEIELVIQKIKSNSPKNE